MSSKRRAHEVPVSRSCTALTAPIFFDLSEEREAERWEWYLELKPKVDHGHQDFINAMRTASLETHLVSITADSSGEFSADEATNKAMDDERRDILRHFHVPLEPCQAGEDVEEQEVPRKDLDEHGSFVMDIVLLPWPIPGESDIPCADTLFMTRDDLALFSLIRSLRKVVLLGNPGIGKSWFQYLYLLFVVRPDVYSSVSEKPNFPSNHQQSIEPPQVIVRLLDGGDAANVYFLQEPDIIVHRFTSIDNVKNVCELMNSKNTLMMFEPGETRHPVPYSRLDKMQILATVSPDEARYKEFVKNGGIRCFKPCPSTRVLLATGALMRPLVDSDLRQAYSSSKIKERIRSMGPFQRYVLPSNGSVVQDALARRKSSLARLSTEDLSKLALHYVLNDDNAEVSHWFCRYEVDREHERPYQALSAYNVATSSEFISHVNQIFASVQLVDKIKTLMNLEAAPQKADDLPLARVWFEDVFAAHASSKGGLRWNALSQTRIFIDVPDEAPDESFSCVPLQLKFNKVIRGKMEKWHQMQKGTLYFRIDPSFPFVDGVWKQGDKVFGFQATTSSKHPKSLETFRSFLVKLGFDAASPLPVTINIVYVVLPRVLKKLFSTKLKLPPSFFWLSKKSNEKEIKNLTKQVKFWITSPPYDFSARADGTNLDEIVQA